MGLPSHYTAADMTQGKGRGLVCRRASLKPNLGVHEKMECLQCGTTVEWRNRTQHPRTSLKAETGQTFECPCWSQHSGEQLALLSQLRPPWKLCRWELLPSQPEPSTARPPKSLVKTVPRHDKRCTVYNTHLGAGTPPEVQVAATTGSTNLFTTVCACFSEIRIQTQLVHA